MVSKGQAGLPRRLFSSTTRRGKPGPACNPPPQGQPATQDGLQGRPAPSLPCACYAPCLPQGKCDLCRFHGLSRLKIKTVRPLGPAKVGCRGRSERPAEAVSTPARAPARSWAPGLAHLAGTWEGWTGLQWTQASPLRAPASGLSAPQTSPGQACRDLTAACTALPNVLWPQRECCPGPPAVPAIACHLHGSLLATSSHR